MYLSVYIKPTLKDRPPDFRGLFSQDLVIGKDGPVSFFPMMRSIITEIAEMYGIFTDPEDFNQELQKLRGWLAVCEMRECKVGTLAEGDTNDPV